MLDRLDSGFVGQRQFLDDAGHELKTPLTVLRGHLELLDAERPAEVAQTRELLLDEVDRMSRLVGDLILLAKSRRPDFVASAGGPGRADRACWRRPGLGDRDWRSTASPAATRRLDEQRLTQAALQLADNAVKHTRPRRHVAIGSRGRGVVRLWVRDTGDGVGRGARGRIFERFGRGACRRATRASASASRSSARSPAHGGDRTLGATRSRTAPFVITCRDDPSPARPPTGGVTHGPHPDRRGRAAHRLVRGQGAARRGPPPTVAADGPSGLDQALSGRLRPDGARHRAARMDGFEVLDRLRSQGSGCRSSC